MKVLVTGGTGFVGRHLVRTLIEKGALVRMLVRMTSNIKEFEKLGVELVHGDITERASLHGIAEDINIVYHLAAMGHVSAISRAAYQKSFDINVNGTKNLAEECCNYKIDRFIHFSSTAAMGLIKLPVVDETVPCQPRTPYQKSKRDSELVALLYWENYHLPAVVLRPSMIYGPGGSGEFLKFCRLMDKGLFPRVGWGKNLTPIVYVKDIVEAALLAAKKGIPGQVYLITSSKSYELTEIRNIVVKYLGGRRFYPYIPVTMAKLIAHVMEKAAKLCHTTPLVTRQNIESTITDRVFSVAKAQREIGYAHRVSLEQGIKETISWYCQSDLL